MGEGASAGGQAVNADRDIEPNYSVVVNHEEQFSIWVVGMELPPGWQCIGVDGSKEFCLDHIEKTWTDMRPRSLRVAMAADAELKSRP